MSRSTTLRQLLIIQRLRQMPANFDELSRFVTEKLTNEDLEPHFDKRTFHRDKLDIAKVHKIQIEYDSRRKKYCIVDTGEAQDRLIDALQLLALSTGDNLSQYVQLETRRSLGREHFQPLLSAIKERNMVSLLYHKFGYLEAEKRLVEPYALKESQGRWYLVAFNEGLIKTYGLDRIKDLEVTKKRFKYPENWSVSEHFKDAFGIINHVDGPQDVILSFSWEQGNYVKAYPLHSSQQVIGEANGEIQIALRVSITYDLVREILSHREEVEVLEPLSLKEEVQKSLETTLSYYARTETNT